MIGLITVNYNQYQLTREFLDSLATVNDAKNLSVYIADVSTKKETFKIANYPMKVVIKSLPNNGYAYGINEGTKYFIDQGLDKFCAINNDIFFDRNFSCRLIQVLKKRIFLAGKYIMLQDLNIIKNIRNKILAKFSGMPEALTIGIMSTPPIEVLMR